MKKMIVTIIILFIIFISMVIYRNMEKENELKVDEINKIEEYIGKIYGWKEITNEALPEFDDINNAEEKWIWNSIRENLSDFEVEYDQIENKIKDLYGTNLKKQYPKEGTEFIKYDEENKKYRINEILLDAVKDSYLLNKIDKNNNGYTVEIIEYLVDYTNEDDGKIIIKDLNEKIIKELTTEEATESNIKKIIKDNIDAFNKKKITLEKENENIIIKKVEKE